MGLNATPVVGKVRLTQPIANTIERLLQDGEKAKALALKLEEELIGDDEEEMAAASDGAETEKKMPGLGEKGSNLVDETVTRLINAGGLDGEQLDEEQRIRKVRVCFGLR